MKKILFGVTTIILIAVVFYFGFWLGDENMKKCASREEIVAEIKNRLVEGMVINEAEDKIYHLINPVVNEVGQNYLMVSASIQQDPLDDLFYGKIKILIDENTEFEKWKLTTEEELKDDPTLTSYRAELGNFENITEGTEVYLIESFDNIRGVQEIRAQKISVSE